MSSESKSASGFPRGAGVQTNISNAQSVYITFVLACVACLAAADRNILAVLLVPIQNDLGASDAAMGALNGIAWSLVYVTVALPVARLADRGHRRNLLAAAVAFWSVMTMLCGAATNFISMLLIRSGVAAGESAYQPATFSLIGDLFSMKRRGTAIGFITVGTSIGISLGAFLAGFITENHSWQLAFIVMGIPGVLIALCIFFTVPEPARGRVDGGEKAGDEVQLGWWPSIKYVATIPTVWALLPAKILMSVAFMGYLAWLPAYMQRVHGMGTQEMSMWYGITIGIGAVLANMAAGFISDILVKRGANWRMIFSAIMTLSGAPIVLAVVLAPNITVLLVTMLAHSFVTGGVSSVSIAAGLDIVKPRMRAFMAAAMAMCVSLIGAGLGPYILGIVNDIAKQTYGDQSLRYTLLLVPVSLALSGVFYLISSLTANRDVARARGEEAAA
ncbi:MAG: MFS transporter [Caulobacterales bacterium]